VPLELGLESRAGCARRDASRARHGVDLEHPAHALEVDRDRRLLRNARLDSADHARASSEGNRGRGHVGAPLEEVLDIALVARVSHHIRWMVEAATKGPHHVAVGASVGMKRALIRIATAYRRQRSGRLEARRREPHILQPRRALDLRRPEAQLLAGAEANPLDLLGRGLLVLQPPAPELSLWPGHRADTMARVRGYP
jgi:hypothetical protein